MITIKYFNNETGLFEDITGNVGDGIVIGASGWTTSPVPSGTTSGVSWGQISGSISSQTDLNETLATKVTKNPSITGATKTKITYDSKGLVTGGTDLIASDISGQIGASKIGDGSIDDTEFGIVS